MASSLTNTDKQENLHSIQRQIHEKKTSILDSTRRMQDLAHQCETVGTGIAVELDEQEEKLTNIERRCDGIDANLVHVQRNLNKLKSPFGGLKNIFHPLKSSFPKSASQPELSNSAKKKTATVIAKTTRPTNLNHDTDTYFGKPRSTMDDIERETEDRLHDIHQSVNCLESLALEINKKLESQKPLTERLGTKIDVLNDNVNKKNKDMKSILLS
ncbi:unnamed protein product [Rotaria sp. Silwood1]|nr:unnamed protein product [Rotaria sp. Silwood1]CAF3399198.1 unnamed protein product [Rotaria sp. Silwood1]CAF3399793.1 unnamed protein product [Rotaria sp. Silwood1]CAF4565553.1 unnamed protein product [Rotaria sp. Silwood1]CAF4573383.1 unnamed protein product [Rotaria sp. Silwood1]